MALVLLGDHRQYEPVQPARFVARWYQRTLVGAFGFFAVLMLSLASDARSNPAALAYSGIALALLIVATARAWRVPTITMNDQVVVVRSFFHTRQLPWTDVRAVGVTRGTSAALLPFRVPYFQMVDGSVVRADEIRSLRAPSVVDDVVAEAERRLTL